MHCYKTKSIMFFYNSDLSGDVEIINVRGMCVITTIPGDELLGFLAECVRQKKISKIEKMTTEEILGI